MEEKNNEGKKFCEKCGQILKEPPQVKGLVGMLSKKPEPTYYEFKDGFYCVKCAKIVIEEKRTPTKK